MGKQIERVYVNSVVKDTTKQECLRLLSLCSNKKRLLIAGYLFLQLITGRHVVHKVVSANFRITDET